MEFQNEFLETLISDFKSFEVEGFNIFAVGEDHLPHWVCTCPNKNFVKAVCALLTTAKQAQELRGIRAPITSSCYLSPQILTNGDLALVAAVIDDAGYVDGRELEYETPEFLLGTPEYDAFVRENFMAESAQKRTQPHE